MLWDAISESLDYLVRQLRQDLRAWGYDSDEAILEVLADALTRVQAYNAIVTTCKLITVERLRDRRHLEVKL